MSEDPIKKAWQASADTPEPPALEDVRATADKFYRRIRRRNAIEYVACVMVIAVCAVRIFTWPYILHKIGFAMIAAGALFVGWQLHRRASAVAPETAGAIPIYDFLRGQFARQRDALKSVLWWYILPLVPGMALVLAANGLDPRTEAAGPPHWVRWVALVFIFAVIGGVWWLNRSGARKLQKHIDEIDALTGAET
jgi:hypothetical protein